MNKEFRQRYWNDDSEKFLLQQWKQKIYKQKLSEADYQKRCSEGKFVISNAAWEKWCSGKEQITIKNDWENYNQEKEKHITKYIKILQNYIEKDKEKQEFEMVKENEKKLKIA